MPKFFFLGVAITGSLLIWLVKALGDAQSGVIQLTVVVIPVSLILIYCIVASRSPVFHLREEQIGDNAYYLGFLFTLSSLAYALWSFQQGSKEATDIISSFGVALWSTIFGIALRVYFAQLRQDPDDVEKDARAKIAETANVLSVELNQATVSFNSYRRNLQQSVEEAFVSTTERVNEALSESIQQFSATTSAMSAQIQGTFDEFTGQAKKLNAASAKTVQALELLHQRIERIEAPENILTEKINRAFAEFEGLGQKLNQLGHDQEETFAKMNASASLLAQALQGLNTHVSAFQDNSETVRGNIQNLNGFAGHLGILSQGLERLSQEVGKIVAAHGGASSSIAHHADELAAQLERSRKYTEETHDALTSMVGTLEEKMQ